MNILKTKFKFENKDVARRFFQELRLTFTDLNYLPFKSEDFVKQEETINAKIQEKSVHA